MTKEEIGRVIKESRVAAGLTQLQVAESLNRPQNTVSAWEMGRAQPDANTLFELFRVLGRSVDEAFGFTKQPFEITSPEKEHIKKYRALDVYGQNTVSAVLDYEYQRCVEQANSTEEIRDKRVIPLYRVPAAAGYASPIYGSDFDYYTLEPEDPQGAVFAIRVQGDSMEPDFPDGSIAFCNKDPLQDGDIGVFCLDGDSFIKQYHYDHTTGTAYLFSLNRDRADADKRISRTGGQSLTCFGRVMTTQRFPLPV